MINHAYSIFAGSLVSDGTPVSTLTAQRTPEVINQAMRALRGATAETAAEFARHAVKLLDSSSFRAVLWQHDERMTLQPHEITLQAENSKTFVDQVLAIPQVLLQYALLAGPDFQTGHSGSRACHERAAAILAGLLVRLHEVSE